jgi:hypothetical protein
MLAAIASVFLGICGWLIAKLIFEPGKEILDLRREVQECLIVYGNLSKDAPAEERRMAAEAFRRVGAGLSSRYIAAYPWVRWCLGRFSLDIHSAGTLLVGMAHTTQFEGFSYANISPTVPIIQGCLRLPSLGQPPMIRALMENTVQPTFFENE